VRRNNRKNVGATPEGSSQIVPSKKNTPQKDHEPAENGGTSFDVGNKGIYQFIPF